MIALALALIAAPLKAWQMAEIRSVGARRGLLMAVNPLVSDVPRALVMALMLAQLPSWFLEIGRLVGGALLIGMVWHVIRKAYRAGVKREAGATTASLPSDIPRSLALWMLDPVPYALWATVAGPLLLASWRRVPSWGLVFLASLYGALLLAMSIYYILVFVFKKHGVLVTRLITGFFMVAVVIAACMQLWSGGEALIARFF